MSKVYKGKYKDKTWSQRVCVGDSPAEVAMLLGVTENEIELTEVEKSEHLLSEIPEEFRSRLSYMAYERGHSAGEAEVELILQELVNDLKPCIQEFEKRVREESLRKVQQQ